MIWRSGSRVPRGRRHQVRSRADRADRTAVVVEVAAQEAAALWSMDMDIQSPWSSRRLRHSVFVALTVRRGDKRQASEFQEIL